FVFFFQAEDGIRGFHVTGVQTCALPIFPAATISAVPATRNIRPSGPAMPPAPVATPSLGVFDDRVGGVVSGSSGVSVTITVVVLGRTSVVEGKSVTPVGCRGR